MKIRVSVGLAGREKTHSEKGKEDVPQNLKKRPHQAESHEPDRSAVRDPGSYVRRRRTQ